MLCPNYMNQIIVPNDRQNQSYTFFAHICLTKKSSCKELCHITEVQKLDDFLIDLSSNAYILCHYDFCQN